MVFHAMPTSGWLCAAAFFVGVILSPFRPLSEAAPHCEKRRGIAPVKLSRYYYTGKLTDRQEVFLDGS
jgi:hypothetical protein